VNYATLTMPIRVQFIIPMLTRQIAYMCSKNDYSSFSRTSDMMKPPTI